MIFLKCLGLSILWLAIAVVSSIKLGVLFGAIITVVSGYFIFKLGHKIKEG